MIQKTADGNPNAAENERYKQGQKAGAKCLVHNKLLSFLQKCRKVQYFSVFPRFSDALECLGRQVRHFGHTPPSFLTIIPHFCQIVNIYVEFCREKHIYFRFIQLHNKCRAFLKFFELKKVPFVKNNNS